MGSLGSRLREQDEINKSIQYLPSIPQIQSLGELKGLMNNPSTVSNAFSTI